MDTQVMPASPQPTKRYAPSTWWVRPLAGLLIPVTFLCTLYGSFNSFATIVGLLVAIVAGLTAFLSATSFIEQRQDGSALSESDGRSTAYVFSITVMLLTSLFMVVFGSSLPGPTAVEKPTYSDPGPLWTPPVTPTTEPIPPEEDYIEPTEEVAPEATPTTTSPTRATTKPPARTTVPPAEAEPPPPVVPAPPPPADPPAEADPPVQQDPPPPQDPDPDPGIAPEDDPFGPPPF